MAKLLFNRYIWLVDTIIGAGKITFEEINDKWIRNKELNELSEDLPLRTFHNHRVAIQDIFDINIECDTRNGYVYYLENAGDMEKGNVRTWLINTFAVNNLINESHQIKNRILFEQIPSGQQYLTVIIKAMRDNLCLKITYQSFWRDEPNTFDVEPYCVKIFKQRWYMLARSPYYDRLRTYSLDRVQGIQGTDKKFKLPKNFKPEEYFDDNYGIITDENIKPCIIEIKVDSAKQKYLNTLPLHPSQKEIEHTEEYSVFRYYIRPTYDFAQEILSHRNEIEVLSPLNFRNEIAEIVHKMNSLYPDNS
jgi:hypothetical protein